MKIDLEKKKLVCDLDDIQKGLLPNAGDVLTYETQLYGVVPATVTIRHFLYVDGHISRVEVFFEIDEIEEEDPADFWKDGG